MSNPKTTKATLPLTLDEVNRIYADRKAAVEKTKAGTSAGKDFNALAESVYASRRGARA